MNSKRMPPKSPFGPQQDSVAGSKGSSDDNLAPIGTPKGPLVSNDNSAAGSKSSSGETLAQIRWRAAYDTIRTLQPKQGTCPMEVHYAENLYNNLRDKRAKRSNFPPTNSGQKYNMPPHKLRRLQCKGDTISDILHPKVLFNTTHTTDDGQGPFDRMNYVVDPKTHQLMVMPLSINHCVPLMGGPVLSAGEITINEGKVLKATNGSGHYCPSPVHLMRLIKSIPPACFTKDTTVVVFQIRPKEPLQLTLDEFKKWQTKQDDDHHQRQMEFHQWSQMTPQERIERQIRETTIEATKTALRNALSAYEKWACALLRAAQPLGQKQCHIYIHDHGVKLAKWIKELHQGKHISISDSKAIIKHSHYTQIITRSSQARK